MPITSYRLRNTGLALMLALSASAAQAQSKTIELQTDEGLLTIPLQDSPGLQLLSDGNIAATAQQGFICQQGASCSDVQVSISATDGGEFSLSTSTVTQGINFQVNWDARGAWECTGSGLTGTAWHDSNPKPPSGVETVSTDNLSVGDHQVAIVCQNGPVEASGALTLTVEEPTGEIAGCDNVPALSDYSGWAQSFDSRYPFGSSDPQTFADVFTEWPGTGTSDLVSIAKGTYLAVSFNSGDLSASSSGQIRKESPQGLGSSETGADTFIGTFSKCPGDFDPNSPALAEGCIQRVRSINQLVWGGPGSGIGCELEANTDYFLNIVYTGSQIGELPPAQAPCEELSRCGHNFAPKQD